MAIKKRKIKVRKHKRRKRKSSGVSIVRQHYRKLRTLDKFLGIDIKKAKPKPKKRTSCKNCFALNLADMIEPAQKEDIGFNILVVPKLTKETVKIGPKHNLDSDFVILDETFPLDQLKATCEIAAGNYNIRCYHHTEGKWKRIRGVKLGKQQKR
jgi:hypothetical protein